MGSLISTRPPASAGICASFPDMSSRSKASFAPSFSQPPATGVAVESVTGSIPSGAMAVMATGSNVASTASAAASEVLSHLSHSPTRLLAGTGDPSAATGAPAMVKQGGGFLSRIIWRIWPVQNNPSISSRPSSSANGAPLGDAGSATSSAGAVVGGAGGHSSEGMEGDSASH